MNFYISQQPSLHAHTTLKKASKTETRQKMQSLPSTTTNSYKKSTPM